MADDSITIEEPAVTATPRPRGRKADPEPVRVAVPEPDAAVVLVDYTGPSGAAPLAFVVKGHGPQVLHPGFNQVARQTWAAMKSHAGVSARLGSDVLVVMKTAIPRRLDPLLPLIDRTFSAAGLDAIEEAERDRYGDKPRGKVVAAITAQRARVAKRIKPTRTPKAPGRYRKIH